MTAAPVWSSIAETVFNGTIPMDAWRRPAPAMPGRGLA